MLTRYPVAVFFTLAYLISGSVAIPLIASLHGIIEVKLPGFLALVAAGGASIAGIVTAALVGGRAGITDLLLSAVKWRVSPWWYVVALLSAPALQSAAFAVNSLLGVPFPPVGDKLQMLLPVLLIITLQAGVGEEIGWRGFAQPRLQERYGALVAALVIGGAWSVWHLPLFLVPDSPQWVLWQTLGVAPAVAGYSAHIVLTAIIYAWALNASRGSVLIPILLHGSTNTTSWLLSFSDLEHYGILPTLLFVAFEGVWAAVLIALYGPKRLAPSHGGLNLRHSR